MYNNTVARLEVPAGDMATVCREENRAAVTARLTDLGFKYVALDLKGYRTGSLNYGL